MALCDEQGLVAVHSILNQQALPVQIILTQDGQALCDTDGHIYLSGSNSVSLLASIPFEEQVWLDDGQFC